MKITPDIIRYEFIGLQGLVAQSQHEDYLGIGGTVISETKNTFTFQHKDKKQSVIKKSAIFNFKFDDDATVQIDGKLLIGRPEDRLKRTMKRLW